MENARKKPRSAWIAMVCLIAAAVCAILCVTLKILEHSGLYLCRHGNLYGTALLLGMILAIAGIFALLWAVSRRVWVALMFWLLLSPIFFYLLVLCVFAWGSSAGWKYHTLTSDDGRHQIVAEEKPGFLQGPGYVAIYEKTSFCTMEKLGDFVTDDGYLPFTLGTASVTWLEDGVQLHGFHVYGEHSFRFYYGAP